MTETANRLHDDDASDAPTAKKTTAAEETLTFSHPGGDGLELADLLPAAAWLGGSPPWSGGPSPWRGRWTAKPWSLCWPASSSPGFPERWVCSSRPRRFAC
ncbi:hypothetical protein L7D48_00070 [Streptomyces sp. S1A]|uniref:hypothetical protein n=1 Tax=Streptomyces sp. ICN903 TaxID=2964654 RepID=UPI001EDC5374|nr:hypothetical protein [Streptomyces sp. ICN903]MCG3038982.1 hypothetical protein [Streptomyces sp. ICN903]